MDKRAEFVAQEKYLYFYFCAKVYDCVLYHSASRQNCIEHLYFWHFSDTGFTNSPIHIFGLSIPSILLYDRYSLYLLQTIAFVSSDFAADSLVKQTTLSRSLERINGINFLLNRKFYKGIIMLITCNIWRLNIHLAFILCFEFTSYFQVFQALNLFFLSFFIGILEENILLR